MIHRMEALLRNPSKGTGDVCPWCQYTKDKQDSLRTKRKEVSGKPTQPDEGVLAKMAASILMKCLYAARMARFDLLRPIQGLAKYLTKWGKRQDEELHQLMSYIYSTKSWKTVGWIADKFEDLVPHLFTDADFAGCDQTLRSTSGIHMSLMGPRSSFPLAGQSKRQNCISQSTTEAELVAASLGAKNYGIS